MSTESEQRPMQGRTVLVTGGSGGIGYETARVLARWGAQVIITGREAEAASGRSWRSAARAAVNWFGCCRPTMPPSVATSSWPIRSARPSLT